jgi:hypothetical protein
MSTDSNQSANLTCKRITDSVKVIAVLIESAEIDVVEINQTFRSAKMNICTFRPARHGIVGGHPYQGLGGHCAQATKSKAVANWPASKGFAGQPGMVADVASCATGQALEYAGESLDDRWPQDTYHTHRLNLFDIAACKAQTSTDLH